jgi:hypothetical protein
MVDAIRGVEAVVIGRGVEVVIVLLVVVLDVLVLETCSFERVLVVENTTGISTPDSANNYNIDY